MTSETSGNSFQDLDDNLKQKLLDCKLNLDSVEDLVNKLDNIKEDDLKSNLTELEIAKLNWMRIFAINSLYFVYLKNSGVSLKDHQIMTELGRIKNYLARINDIAKEEQLKKEYQNTIKIDKKVTERIIKRTLWMNTKKKTAEDSNHQQDDADDNNHESPNKRVKI